MADAQTDPKPRRRWLGVGAAGLALLACALPWHQSSGQRASFAVSPDFHPSVLSDARVCTAADHWSIVLIAAIALGLQILLAARWPRQRILLAVGTLLTGLVATLVVPVTAISGHGLFHRIHALAGQILYLGAALLLVVAAFVQIVSRPASPPATVSPPVDPPPAG
jgi:hypothetical protein